MENPQTISPQIMYNYDKKANQTWNMKEYRTPREYLDPIGQVQARKFAEQKKGQPNKKYVTKRGYFMDYPMKVSKGIPSSSIHGQNKPWSFEKEAKIAKFKKMDSSLIKQTYIEKIELEQKNRKSPGIGAYSLQKSMKEKDAMVALMSSKKQSVGDRRFFYENTQSISGGVPGAGNHNPHDQILKIRKNKTLYSEWQKKHSLEREKKEKRDASIPAPGTYNPMNCTFTTFDTISKSPKGKQSSKFDGFGKDARFSYTRPDKKKIKEVRPSPNSYNTVIEWKRKKDSMRGWNETISKGFETISIYNH